MRHPRQRRNRRRHHHHRHRLSIQPRRRFVRRRTAPMILCLLTWMVRCHSSLLLPSATAVRLFVPSSLQTVALSGRFSILIAQESTGRGPLHVRLHHHSIQSLTAAARLPAQPTIGVRAIALLRWPRAIHARSQTTSTSSQSSRQLSALVASAHGL